MIDLHIHTLASGDGEFSSQEIVQMAKQKELQAIAITDHDSVKSVAEALHWGEKYGVEVVPGCEFSAVYHEKWLHILGYFIDHTQELIKKWCNEIEVSRVANVDVQIEKLRAARFYLEKSKVVEDSPLPMPICFSKAIFEDVRNAQHPLLTQYGNEENPLLRFCLEWLVTGRPYNAPQYIPNAELVIKLILQSGGVAVLAHPAATLTSNDDHILDELIGMGLRGIEACSTWHTPEQEEYYSLLAKKRKLLVTSGSDFHGKSKPHIQLGQVKHSTYKTVELLKALRP